MTAPDTLRFAQTVPRNELEQLDNRWHVSGKLPFYVMVRDAQPNVYFKREDLEAIDPRLAPLIELLLATYTQESTSATIAASLRLWRGAPSIRIADRWLSHKYFDRLNRVIDIDREKRTVWFEGDTAVVSESAGLKFAKPIDLNQAHSLSFEYLDKQFPGSTARLEAATSLSLTGEEMVGFIFMADDTRSIELPGDLCPI